jgi:hypothetical protein
MTVGASSEEEMPLPGAHSDPQVDKGVQDVHEQPCGGDPAGGGTADQGLASSEDDWVEEHCLPDEVVLAMANAWPLTSFVDEYMWERIGDSRYFSEIYFAHGKRSVEIAEGAKFTTYTCTCGCLKGSKPSYSISSKQNAQAIFDHIFRQRHVLNCCVKGVALNLEELEDYMAAAKLVNPRCGRWQKDGNKESRSSKSKKRSRSRVPKAEQTGPDPTSVALFANPTGIASHCLNYCGPAGTNSSQQLQGQLKKQANRHASRTH